RRNRPGTHGEDVAQYAADAGRRALIGLDIGGMVMALHLEDDAIAIADIDDTGILPRTLDDMWSCRRQGTQPFLRGFVGTMLVPHRGEDAEFGEARLAADQLEDTVIFIRLQSVGFHKFRCDFN